MKPSVCPLCPKPSQKAFAPFCSKACKTMDLHRWLSEVYTVPTNEKPVVQSPDSNESLDPE